MVMIALRRKIATVTLHGPFSKLDKRFCFNSASYSANADELIDKYCSQPRRKTFFLLKRSNYSNDFSFQRVENVPDTTVHITDNFQSTSDKQQMLCELLKGSDMGIFYLSPGERKISGDDDTVQSILCPRAGALLSSFKVQLHQHAQKQTGKSLKEAGSIVSWLNNPKNYGQGNLAKYKQKYGYWIAHCDKANNNEYDYSVLLYLNTDFEGGNLVFMDDGIDFVVEPKGGRVVIFSSSSNNIHRVEPVISGDRFLLSVWYSIL